MPTGGSSAGCLRAALAYPVSLSDPVWQQVAEDRTDRAGAQDPFAIDEER